MGMDRKERYRLTHSLSKISGYATGYFVTLLLLLFCLYLLLNLTTYNSTLRVPLIL